MDKKVDKRVDKVDKKVDKVDRRWIRRWIRWIRRWIRWILISRGFRVHFAGISRPSAVDLAGNLEQPPR